MHNESQAVIMMQLPLLLFLANSNKVILYMLYLYIDIYTRNF